MILCLVSLPVTIFEEAKDPDANAETERRPAVMAEALVVQSEAPEKRLPAKVVSMATFREEKEEGMVEAVRDS